MQSRPCKGLIAAAIIILDISSVNCALIKSFGEVAEAATFQFNDTFEAALKKLDFLSLHLQHTDTSYHHPFVKYLLRQPYCPILLTVGAMSYFTEMQRHRAVTVTSEADLDSVLSRYSHRAGHLFCILMREIDESRLLVRAELIWQQRGVYKVYYITSHGAVFYNPFTLRNAHQYGALVNASQTALDEIVDNLNAYPVRVYIFDSVYSRVFGDPDTKQITRAEGPDSNIAKLLSQNMNFTLLLQWPDDNFFGTHLDNGTYNGAIGRTMRYETDITMTGFFVKDYLTRDIAFTFPVYMDELCCYVTKAKRIPPSVAPLYAVKIDMWFGFLLAGLTCSFVWMTLRWLNLSIRPKVGPNYAEVRKPRYARVFSDTWVLWLRANLTHFPPFYSERIFVVSLCLVSVIFGSIFESSLATLYIHPLYYRDINTMAELDSTNYKIYIRHAAIKDDLFRGQNSSVYESLNRKLFLIGETEERIINIMMKRGGFAAVTRSSATHLDDFPFFAKKKVHKIKECPKKYHIAFLLPKVSPYEKRINGLLLRYLQADLINHWIKMTQHKVKLSVYNSLNILLDQSHIGKVLTLTDLQLSFYILIFGSILAILTCFAELLLRRKSVKAQTAAKTTY